MTEFMTHFKQLGLNREQEGADCIGRTPTICCASNSRGGQTSRLVSWSFRAFSARRAPQKQSEGRVKLVHWARTVHEKQGDRRSGGVSLCNALFEEGSAGAEIPLRFALPPLTKGD